MALLFSAGGQLYLKLHVTIEDDGQHGLDVVQLQLASYPAQLFTGLSRP